MNNSAQVVGNAGLYYACYRLSLLGWNVMPTSRNARGVDVIAYNHDCTQKVSIQVKSLSRRNPVPLGTTLERIIGDYWVITNNLQGGGDPSAYVLLPEEVKARAHRGEKEGKVSLWLQPRAYDDAAFREAWHRIGNPNEPGQPAAVAGDSRPERLSAGIGGYMGPSFSIELADGALRYEAREYGYANPKVEVVSSTQESWAESRAALDAIRVWAWKENYPNPGVCDGTQWRFEIAYGEIEMRSCGDNSYPRTFRRLLDAVKALLCGRDFH